MNIRFSPVCRMGNLALSRVGDELTVNGVAYDFGPLGEGDILPRNAVGCEMLASDVTRTNGVIHMTVTLPYGEVASEAVRFPVPIIALDGVIEIPT